MLYLKSFLHESIFSARGRHFVQLRISWYHACLGYAHGTVPYWSCHWTLQCSYWQRSSSRKLRAGRTLWVANGIGQSSSSKGKAEILFAKHGALAHLALFKAPFVNITEQISCVKILLFLVQVYRHSQILGTLIWSYIALELQSTFLFVKYGLLQRRFFFHRLPSHVRCRISTCISI